MSRVPRHRPPGTGKTSTIVGVLSILLAAETPAQRKRKRAMPRGEELREVRPPQSSPAAYYNNCHRVFRSAQEQMPPTVAAAATASLGGSGSVIWFAGGAPSATRRHKPLKLKVLV